MKSTCLIYFFIFFTLQSAAQNKIDSLTQSFSGVDKNSIDAALLNLELSSEYIHTFPDKAQIYAEEAVKISGNINNKEVLSKALNISGLIHSDKGDLEKALEYFIEALELAESINDKKLQANILNRFSDLYRKQGNFEKTLEASFKVLEIYKELGDKIGIGDTYNNIAIAYYWTHDIEKATEFFEKALEVRKTFGTKADIAGAMENLAAIYVQNGEYEKALKICFNTLEIEKEINHKHMMASTLGNIGTIYLDLKKHDMAIEYQLKSIDLAKEIKSKPLITSGHQNLHAIYLDLEDHERALKYHKLHTTYKDSILNEKNQEQILEMEAKYENHKKELEIDNLQKENALKDAEVKKQNIQKTAFAFGFILVLIIVVIIYKGYKQKEKSNKLLAEQKMQVDKAYSALEEKNNEITNSIKYAQRIQEAILPSLSEFNQCLNDSFVLFKPKDVVSGDFYWLESLPNLSKGGAIYIACADCTGHGVPGAMVSVTCSNSLSKALLEEEITDTGKLLDRTRELVIKSFQKSDEEVKDGMDIALCCIESTQNDKAIISFSGANNPLYILRQNDNKDFEIIKGDRQPIGNFDNSMPFNSHKLTLEKGDQIYLFTDGYADQFGGNQDKKMGYNIFRKKLKEGSHLKMADQKEKLLTFLNDWKGNKSQVDDICIIGIRI